MNWKIIKEPYPFNNHWKKEIISAFFFGLFVFLFLVLFQPFGLSNYRSDTKSLELAGYGLVTTFVLLFNNTLFSIAFPKWFSKKCWTVGKNILYTTYMFLCIGMGNFLYSVWSNYLEFELNGFLFYQGMTIMVGLFPVTISTFIIYSNRLKKSITDARQLNSALDNKTTSGGSLIEIPSQNKSENVQVDLNELLCIRSVENYVEVSVKQNETLKKLMIRNTLKNLESHLSNQAFIKKCHRSYLVNLENVRAFSGNAQGLTLTFQNETDLKIPVSRSYVNKIKTLLTQ